jgi:hypothetical protein
MCTPQGASHLVIKVCEMSYDFYYIYANNSLIVEEHPKLQLIGYVSMKTIVQEHQKKKKKIDVQIKVALEWQPLIGVNTLT